MRPQKSASRGGANAEHFSPGPRSRCEGAHINMAVNSRASARARGARYLQCKFRHEQHPRSLEQKDALGKGRVEELPWRACPGVGYA